MNEKKSMKISAQKPKRFIASGRENVAPRALEENHLSQKVISLQEQAEKVSSLLGNKIIQSKEETDKIISDIAFYQNKLQTKKSSFKARLKTKRDEQKDKYQKIISDIQSEITIQLAENEQLASKIATFQREIEDFSKPKVMPAIEPISFDFSKKTERQLKERESEIRKRCDFEFNPLFEKLKMKHMKEKESLQQKYEQKIAEIDSKTKNEISAFAPRIFISQEELRVRKNYETIFQTEKDIFEKKRDEINCKIAEIESEKQQAIHTITDEVEAKIYQGEQIFNEKMADIKNSIMEPVIPDFSKEFEITPEQEDEFRKASEQKLKDNFQKILEQSVSDVAQRRELMEKEIDDYEKGQIISLTQKYESEIKELEDIICSQREEADFMRAEINSFKAEWNDMNQSKHDNEEIKEKLETQIKKLESDFKQIVDQIEITKQIDKEQPDEELNVLENEISKLANDVKIAKKFHFHLLKTKSEKHEQSLAMINQRFSQLTAMKDEAIVSLTNELKNIKKKTKILSASIESKLQKYQA